MLFIVLFDSYASDFEHPDAILLDPAPAAVGDVFREFRFERRAVNYLAVECICNSLVQGLRRVLPQKTVSPDYIVHNVFFHAHTLADIRLYVNRSEYTLFACSK